MLNVVYGISEGEYIDASYSPEGPYQVMGQTVVSFDIVKCPICSLMGFKHGEKEIVHIFCIKKTAEKIEFVPYKFCSF